MAEKNVHERFAEAHGLLTDGDYPAAIRGFEEVIRLCPEMEGAWGNRGYALVETGHDEEALEDFDMVVKLRPEDPFGHAYRAVALRNLGRWAEALEAAARSIKRAGEDPPDEALPAYLVRAWLFMRAGQYAAACDDLEMYYRGGYEDSLRPLLDLCQEVRDEGRDTCADGPDGRLQCHACLCAKCGYSFNTDPNPDWQAQGGQCPYAHCMETMPARNGMGPGVCPVFWHDCPGGEETVQTCPVVAASQGSCPAQGSESSEAGPEQAT